MGKKVRIGIKYGKIAFLTVFIGLIALNLFLYFISEDRVLPIFFEEKFKDRRIVVSLLFNLLIISPIVEESLFRLLPIGIVLKICGKENKIVLWPVIIISSVIFGWIHGSWRNIFIQGSVGIVLSAAFLKGGYVSSVVAHIVCNFLVIMISIIGILFYL